MPELIKTLQTLKQELESAWQKLQLDQKITQLSELEKVIAEPELWLNPNHAKQQHELFAKLNNEVTPWQLIRTQLHDLQEIIDLNDQSLNTEIDAQLKAISDQFKNLKKNLRFNGKYDNSDAILRVTAGVGGVESHPLHILGENFSSCRVNLIGHQKPLSQKPPSDLGTLPSRSRAQIKYPFSRLRI